jgi:UDP-3-O-[3-hydroxymyristoyl] glucosamine N-acyltransferase
MRWQSAEFVMAPSQHTAGSIAKLLGARLDGLATVVCSGVASLEGAEQGDLTFVVSEKYSKYWQQSKASIAIVPNGITVPNHDAKNKALLWVEDADVSIAKVLTLFEAEVDQPELGIHKSVVVASTASIGKGVRIGPFTIIEKDVVIGDGVCIHGNVRLARGSRLGAGTILHSGVVIGHDCLVGSNCILFAGVVLGADGFGYCASLDKTHLIKIPHVGNVELGDNIEIGANTCVDRGKFSSTIIGSGTKIDNLVQIGHNCKIGQNCAISGTAAIAGSVEIGNWVQIAGNVGIVPHVTIGDGAKIGAKSGVLSDIPAGESWVGFPAVPLKKGLRQWAAVRKLPKIIAQLKK